VSLDKNSTLRGEGEADCCGGGIVIIYSFINNILKKYIKESNTFFSYKKIM
jgi:hypothetical protein